MWTAEFFEWLEEQGISFPTGLNRSLVRDVAVHHHRETAEAVHWLCTEADRLAAGMERKPRDEEQERQAGGSGWRSYIETALESPFQRLDLGRGAAKPSQFPLEVLEPGEAIYPRERVETGKYEEKYRRLWEGYATEFRKVCELQNRELFLDALLSLSERYLWAIPSSTMDQPDVSLHDHHAVAAGVAAALYRYHEAEGSLSDRDRIKDRGVKKFRFVIGDLSGIQKALFLLASQRVKGVNKIVRARSFLMGMLVEGAALLVRQALGLPVFSVMQNAGGRFVVLAGATPELEERVEEQRRVIERWMEDRYLGELALNLSVTEALAGKELMREGFPEVQRQIGATVERGKLQALKTSLRAKHDEQVYERDRVCNACGVRAGVSADGGEEEVVYRCAACHDEHRLGRLLVEARALYWARSGGAEGVKLYDRLWLKLSKDVRPTADWQTGFRLWRGEETAEGAVGLRYLANYVPVMKESEALRYRELVEEPVENGETKTFECLAADAVEEVGGELTGSPHLAVLKADVDWLGQLFSKQPEGTLSRRAALGRMLDFFFAGQMQWLIRREFPETYTVYAGGDDLLVIGPWRAMMGLAQGLREEFGRWCGGNPNVTLSAGLEIFKPNQPLNRVVEEAEERLEKAKGKGEKGGARKNRVCVLQKEAVAWSEYGKQLKRAEQLSEWLRVGKVSQGFVYRILSFDELRREAENGKEMTLKAASWRARWGYYLARNVREEDKEWEQEKRKFLNELLGLDGGLKVAGQETGARIAVSVALYRNRSPKERR